MKKSQKSLLIQIGILALLLLAIGGYYLMKILPGIRAEKESGAVQIIEGIDKEDVVGIEVAFSDDNGIYHSVLNKIDNEWHIVFPIQYKADPSRIEKMLSDLWELRSEEVITNVTEDKIAEFGFDEPLSMVKLGLESGTQFEILNGRLATVENYYYTMVNHDSNDIYVIYAYRFTHSERTPDELAYKEIFQKLPIPAINSIEVKSSEGVVYRFNRMKVDGEQEWVMRAPLTKKVGSFEVRRKIMQLYPLGFSHFTHYDRDPQLLRHYGLDNPKYYAKLTSEDGQAIDLYISEKTNAEHHYAYSPLIPGIVEIHKSDIGDKFDFSVDEFLETQSADGEEN
jgi:hypothetical protein